MKRHGLCLVLFAASCLSVYAADDYHFDHVRTALLPRDEWGILHTSKVLNETDYAHTEAWRLFYYNKSGHELERDPAYMGAVQEALRRNGFYCGPIDGVFSDEVSNAIAVLQKNYGHHVNGRLTVSVRRALYLP
ncbi:MAG: peptidoglycan-binding domain-containing protein [Chthoniobacterales bacterium]